LAAVSVPTPSTWLPPPPSPPPSSRRGRVWTVVGIVATLGVATVAVVAAIVVGPRWIRVEGHAMAPTLQNGDRAIFVRLRHSPGRGSVVALRYPRDPAKSFVMRIVGMPGERVSIEPVSCPSTASRSPSRTSLPATAPASTSPLDNSAPTSTSSWATIGATPATRASGSGAAPTHLGHDARGHRPSRPDTPMSDLALDEWIRYVFDHPVTDPAWHFDIDAPYQEHTAERTAVLIADTFERSGELLRPFSDAQLNQAFWFLASSSSSEYMCCLTYASVPWPLRQRALRSFVPLFRDVMASRCATTLAHRVEPGATPLNSACFMWWDLLPFDGSWADGQAPRPIDTEVLAVLAELLAIPHDACRESALHGLGHLALFHPEAVPVIDAFLDRSAGLRPELVAYARQARTGRIL
jgi:hypothetical protein